MCMIRVDNFNIVFIHKVRFVIGFVVNHLPPDKSWVLLLIKEEKVMVLYINTFPSFSSYSLYTSSLLSTKVNESGIINSAPF